VSPEVTFSTLSIIRLAVIVVTVSLGYVTVRYRSEPGATPLLAMLAAIFVWQVGDIAAARSPGLAQSLFWGKVVYTTVPVLVTAFFVFVLVYTGQDEYVTPRVMGLLAVEPVVFVAAVWTNGSHGLFLSNPVVTDATYWGINFSLGPVFYGHVVYAYGLVLVGLALLVRLLREHQTLHPRQVYAVIVGGLAPFVADLLYQLRVLPVDLSPIAFTFTALALTAALFQYKLLSASPATQQSIAENIRDGLFVLDGDDEFVEINSVARRQLGLVDDPVLGRSAASVLDHVPDFYDAFDAAADGSQEVQVDLGEETRFYRVQVTVLRDHRNEVIGRQCLISDLTDLKYHETELERQNEQLDQFASVVSHDLRNPLNVASGRVELARETGDLEHLDHVVDALDRMERIVSDVLALARDGKTIDDPDSVSLDSVARAAWTQVETGEAELVVESDRTLRADRDRFQRLLENLFRNAVEHNETPVTVTVGSDGDGFYVVDDGKGIPADKREEVFEHGYSEREDGTGFGLAIVRSIAEAHGWTVTAAESDTGARFEFTTARAGVDRAAATPSAD